MSEQYFLIKNQHGQFISKQKEWLDGSEPKLLFKTVLYDEALNWVFELSLKDTQLRAFVENCELDDKGMPQVDVTYQPPLIAENSLADSANESDTSLATEGSHSDSINENF